MCELKYIRSFITTRKYIEPMKDIMSENVKIVHVILCLYSWLQKINRVGTTIAFGSTTKACNE